MDADGRAVDPDGQARRLGRREFLTGAAAVSAAALVGVRPSAAQAAVPAEAVHGVPLRGMYLTSKDRLTEGRFGTMFKRLPAFTPRDDLLDSLARSMVEDQSVPDDDNLNTSPRLFAGYTFVGPVHRPRHHLRQHPARPPAADPDARTKLRRRATT
jgi:hypothetical protein